jgi:hypothetical protein
VIIDLSVFGQLLGEKLGLGAFAGGMLMGLILTVIILFPVTLIARRKGGGFLPEMLAGFAIFGMNIAFGWWPIWMLIILAFLVALLYGPQIAGRD